MYNLLTGLRVVSLLGLLLHRAGADLSLSALHGRALRRDAGPHGLLLLVLRGIDRLLIALAA